jgi:hypothetical protein
MALSVVSAALGIDDQAVHGGREAGTAGCERRPPASHMGLFGMQHAGLGAWVSGGLQCSPTIITTPSGTAETAKHGRREAKQAWPGGTAAVHIDKCVFENKESRLRHEQKPSEHCLAGCRVDRCRVGQNVFLSS